MIFLDLLAWLVERSQRHALMVMLAGGMLAAVSAITTAHHLGINTNTNLMFPESLPWRHNAIAFQRDFPQFSDLLVAVVDGRIPEATELTAADLAAALALDHTDFKTVRRPDSSPFLSQEGLLFLDTPRLEGVLNRIVDVSPFSARWPPTRAPAAFLPRCRCWAEVPPKAKPISLRFCRR